MQAQAAAAFVCALILATGCDAQFVSASDMALDACSLSGNSVNADKPREEGLADLRKAANLASEAAKLDAKYGELVAGLTHMLSAIERQDLDGFEIAAGIVFDNCLKIETE